MYDDFSNDYDRFVSWPGRLAVELPFIEQQLQAAGAQRILDAACGTGMHTIALAQRGYQAAGADLSAGMIERARTNAATGGVDVRFETAGFGELRRIFGNGSFDALLCLGNSLPHVLTPQALSEALVDFAACLRPDGLLLVQNRNFDLVMATRSRWMEPQAHRTGLDEWVFLRSYDFDPDGLITFNIITLKRTGAGDWRQQITSTRLRPLLQSEMLRALASAGFEETVSYGNMEGAPFEPDVSGNLVVTAQRK
jgi:2-polyprenyl-3-methyl-5-hydroxy-6-metoxy-1,4-benzoquinol methylase